MKHDRFNVFSFGHRSVAALLTALQLLAVPTWMLAGALSSPDGAQPTQAAGSNTVSPQRSGKRPASPVDVVPETRAFFSPQVTDQEITNCRIFIEPLVPVGGAVKPGENAALAAAVRAFENRRSPEDFTAFTGFLSAHPQSRWRAALELNLGVWYAGNFYYDRAFKALIESWDLTKNDAQLPGKILGDRAIAELADLYASLGCAEALAGLLEEIKGRTFLGSSRQKIVSAQEMLGFMYYHADHAYNCGPLTLDALRRQGHPEKDHLDMLFDPEENVNGRNLSELAELSAKAGMSMVAVNRPAGAEFPIPSIIHWKTRHYDVLVEHQGDRYLVRNPFLNQDHWVSQAALEEESTGYVLVPAGQVPAGWTQVSKQEGHKVWGGCHTGTANPGNTGSKECSTCPHSGGPMAFYNMQFALVNLHIEDAPIRYTPAWGPEIKFLVGYNHREAYQPGNFNYSNLGRLWTFNWLSYITDKNSTSLDASVTLYERAGGTMSFTFATGSNTSAVNSQDSSVLTRTVSGTAVTSYTRTFPDGSKYIYNVQTSTVVGTQRQVFLKQVYDPQGHVVTLSYDGQFRVTGITDDTGLPATVLSYELAGDIYKITKVTDPFGRFASFTYNANGQLQSITDPVGIVSQFAYDGDFINKLTTPYGDTTFVAGETGVGMSNQRWLEVTDPMGGKERVEYYQGDLAGMAVNDPAFPTGSVVLPSGLKIENDLLNTRNTFYWDKKAMMTAPGDYSKAYVYHWLHDDATDQITDVLESEKPPLESRIWYNYPGQVAPYFSIGTSSKVVASGRLIDNQQTIQLVKHEYNSQGNPTKIVDPLGRTTSYVYDATGLDLLEVRNTSGSLNELLIKFSYTDATHPTSLHLPLTITDAAGQVTSLSYNAHAQLLTSTVTHGGVNETTSLDYYGNGRLQDIKGPGNVVLAQFVYDSAGRQQAMTDSENYSVSYEYDNIDRLTKVKYADNTFTQVIYDKLDPEWKKDRLGRWTHLFHDALRNVSAAVDAGQRVTIYDWCQCGSLKSIKDGEGHITKWAHDLESRVIQKTFDDGSVVHYNYDDPYRGLLTSVEDQKGQVKHYSYFLDNRLQQVSYTDTVGIALTPPTPSVMFFYEDANHARVTKMTDGTGDTQYEYYPIAAGALGAGRLKAVTPPMADAAIIYAYDELGRRVTSAVNGVSDGITYDTFGRISAAANPLGSFTYTYVNSTSRPDTITGPNGQTTKYLYHPNVAAGGTGNGDDRLQTIWHKLAGGATLSKHDYQYNVAGEITSWQQQTDSNAAIVCEFGYDGAGELLSATRTDATSGALLKQTTFAYDKAGNRTLEQVNAAISSGVPNQLNQLPSRSGAGPMVFEGAVDKPSAVTVGGNAAVVDANNHFKGTAVVSPGQQSVEIKATDGNGNTTTRHAQVTVTAGAANQSFGYDLNGNMTGDGVRSFGWDAENRLVKITIGANTQEFVYNGVGQRVAEKMNGTLTRQWAWDGATLREERDANGNVTKRYFGQGMVMGSALPAGATNKLFYTRDHLGSVREMVDNDGVVRARYDYDAYGRSSGNLVSDTGIPDKPPVSGDFGFTNIYWDSFGSVNLAYYRAYDPDLGRWLSRDPIAENGGINLYGYVSGNPVMMCDPLGLAAVFTFVDGSVKTAHNTNEFKEIAKNAKDGSIKDLDIDGHGNHNYANFTPDNDHNYEGLAGSDGVVALTNSQGQQDELVKNVLGGKFCKNGTIHMHNCQTALGDKNLARSLSNSLPGVTVTGSPNLLAGKTQPLTMLLDKLTLPPDRTYRNGQEILPPPPPGYNIPQGY